MNFGLFCLNTQRTLGATPSEVYSATAEQVRLADETGFDIAWFAEHHFSSYCLCPSPLTMCAYIAPQTKRIQIGPAVIVAPLYEPVRLLEDIGLVDQLSGGRLVLGLGSGYQEYEFTKFGVDLKEARSRLHDVLDFIEAYTAGDPVKFDGSSIQFPETHFSVRPKQKRLPVYLAGLAGDPETQRRAAERGYIPFFTTGWMNVAEMQDIRKKCEASWIAGGGNPQKMNFALQRYIHITEDKKAALIAADGARYVRRIGMAMRHKYAKVEGAFIHETPAEGEPPLEKIVDRMLIGSAEDIAERICNEIETLGMTHMSCFMAIPGLSQKEIMSSIEYFGTKVIPLIKKKLGNTETECVKSIVQPV